jgi:hypothetical protein
MKKVVRLTESDLVKIVKRVISEQDDILIKKGYVLVDVNTLTGNLKNLVTKSIEKNPTYNKFYRKMDSRTKKIVSLISDGNNVIFIVPPEGLNLGPHDIRSIDRYL